MIDYVKQILSAQFESSLNMLDDCIQNCPPNHWHNKIANMEFGYVPYHTLCFVDLYLSASNDSFELREFHNEHDENRFKPKDDYPITQTLVSGYLQICLQKMQETISEETETSLNLQARFDWLKELTRGELHIYNIRHIQHHTGALSASLRRQNINLAWRQTGWSTS